MERPDPKEDPMSNKMFVVVIGLLLLVLVGPLFGPVPVALLSSLDVRTATGWQVVFFLVPLAVILAVLRGWMGRHQRSWADLGWGRPAPPAAMVLGAVVGLGWGVLGTFSYLQFNPDANILELSLFRAFTALVGAGGAVLEDLITRGFVMGELKRLGAATGVQVLASSLLFAAYHSLWGFNIFGFAFSLIYGLILGGLFVIGKRSLTPVILGHSLALLVGEPFLTLSLMESIRMAIGA
jgi:membrane protease YdiL (CAAX protease family)